MAIRKKIVAPASYTTTYECYHHENKREETSTVEKQTEWIHMNQIVTTFYQQLDLIAQFQVQIVLNRPIKDCTLHIENKVSSNLSIVEDSLRGIAWDYTGNEKSIQIDVVGEGNHVIIDYSFSAKVKENMYLHRYLALHNKVLFYVPTLEASGLHMTSCLVKIIVPVVQTSITRNPSYTLPSCFMTVKEILSEQVLIVGVSREKDRHYRMEYLVIIRYKSENGQICVFHKKEFESIVIIHDEGIRQIIGQVLGQSRVISENTIYVTLRFIIR